MFCFLLFPCVDTIVTIGNDSIDNRSDVARFEQNEFHELEILRQVEENPTLTNRAAAGKLGVSVKLAHETLKRMVSKGLLHVKKLNSRRWDYFLTPNGFSTKAQLTIEFLEFSMVFYRGARCQSAQVCRYLSEHGVKTVALLGTGDLAEIVYLGIQEWNLVLIDVYDDDDDTDKDKFMAVDTQRVSALGATLADGIIIAVYDKRLPMGHDYLPEGVERDDRMCWVF